MLPERAVRLEYARAAPADGLNSLVYEADEGLLLALLENPNFQEKHAELLLGRVDTSTSVLTAIAAAGKGKWMACESVRLGLARHAHSSKRIALAAVRQLFLFNLVQVSFSPSTPPDIRRAAEEAILSRVPHLPVGQKLTLARRGPGRVAGAILAEGHPQALKLALSNAFLTESQVLKVLAKEGVADRVVAAIALHPKWSCRYNVRAALVRNPQSPPACVRSFLGDLKLRDLDDMAQIREIAPAVQKMIAEEMERRAVSR